MQLVGDDLFVTNPEILTRGIAEGLANSLLVKVNQIGTLSETLEAVEIAKTHAYSNILSHRITRKVAQVWVVRLKAAIYLPATEYIHHDR